MADQSSNCPSPNPTQNHINKPISSFLGSPRIFNGLLTRSLSDIGTIKTSRDRLYDIETVTSPNSIPDGMQNFNIGNPFGYDRKPANPIIKKPPHNKLESESIGLALIDPKRTSEKSLVLFGAKIKVEIPYSIEVKNSCGDFGEGLISLSTEMESSEDYTCVTTHGPNPRTTHIFDNCIVESCCGVKKLRENSCKSCKVDHTEGKDI